MNKQLLLTISDDVSQLYGVQFGCHFKPITSHHLTLFHICRLDGNDMDKALMESWQNPKGKVRENLSLRAKRCINKTMVLLKRSKLSIDQIVTTVVP